MTIIGHMTYLAGTGQLASIDACVPVIAGAVVERQRLLRDLGRAWDYELRDYAAL